MPVTILVCIDFSLIIEPFSQEHISDWPLKGLLDSQGSKEVFFVRGMQVFFCNVFCNVVYVCICI